MLASVTKHPSVYDTLGQIFFFKEVESLLHQILLHRWSFCGPNTCFDWLVFGHIV